MTRRIILASKSPRRKALLEQIGLAFEIHESHYEEDMGAMNDPHELVKFLALNKARDVAQYYDDAIVIGADTFIIFKDQFIGKPKDIQEAKNILRNFSGRAHEVVTGLAIIDTKNNLTINDVGAALVKFRQLTEEEINSYISTGESLSRAGAYGLTDRAAVLIESINGDFYSVIGLPLNKIYINLLKLGVDAFKP